MFTPTPELKPKYFKHVMKPPELGKPLKYGQIGSDALMRCFVGVYYSKYIALCFAYRREVKHFYKNQKQQMN